MTWLISLLFRQIAAIGAIIGAGVISDAGTNDTLSKKLDVTQANKSLEKGKKIVQDKTKAVKELVFEATMYKNVLADMQDKLGGFKAGFDQSIDYGGAGEISSKQFAPAMPTMEIPESLKQLKQSFTSINEEISISMQDIASTIGNGVAAAISAASSGGDIGRALGASLLNSMGQFLTQFGTQILLVGIGAEALKLSLKSLNGVAAIVAGTAMIAAGGAAMAIASNFASGGGSSSGFSTPSGGGGGYMMPQMSNTAFTLDGRVRGQDLVIATSTTNRNNRR